MINLTQEFTETETSAFSKAQLNPRSGNMRITYRTGNVYVVKSLIEGVDCKGIYLDLVGAPSKGRFFGQYIKGNINFLVVPQ